MKSKFRLIFISLIALYSIIICISCADNPREQDPTHKSGVYFSVSGLPCEECANALQRALLSKNGIISAEVSVKAERNNVKVTYNRSLTSVDEIKDVIANTGREVASYEEF